MTPSQFKYFVNTAMMLLGSLSTGKTLGKTQIIGRTISSDVSIPYPPISTPSDSETASYQADILWSSMQMNVQISGQNADTKSADFAMQLKIAKVPFCQSGSNFIIP